VLDLGFNPPLLAPSNGVYDKWWYRFKTKQQANQYDEKFIRRLEQLSSTERESVKPSKPITISTIQSAPRKVECDCLIGLPLEQLVKFYSQGYFACLHHEACEPMGCTKYCPIFNLYMDGWKDERNSVGFFPPFRLPTKDMGVTVYDRINSGIELENYLRGFTSLPQRSRIISEVVDHFPTGVTSLVTPNTLVAGFCTACRIARQSGFESSPDCLRCKGRSRCSKDDTDIVTDQHRSDLENSKMIDHHRRIENDEKVYQKQGQKCETMTSYHCEDIKPNQDKNKAETRGGIPTKLTLYGILPEIDLNLQAKVHEEAVRARPSLCAQVNPSNSTELGDCINLENDYSPPTKLEYIKTRENAVINALSDWFEGQSELDRIREFYTIMGDFNYEQRNKQVNGTPFTISSVTMKAPSPFDVQLERLIKQYPEVFKEQLNLRAETAVSLEINLSGLYRTPYCYQVPNAYRDKAEEKINEMLKTGIIRPSSSPFQSPLVCVPKKDGRLRLCVDYRAVNAVTIPDSYTLPSIEYIKMHIKGRIFSSLDLREGFMQVTVAEKDRPKTAVKTPWGLFEFNRMPFGLRNAPPTFQRFINSVLHGISNIFVYIDDVVIFTDDYPQHLEILNLVLARLDTNGLIINAEKSTFLSTSITYLGMEFDENGYRPVDTCLPKIQNYIVPKDRKGIQKFLGVINYYRSHIPNLASVAAPLYHLLNKAAKFIWGPKEQESFELLKTLFHQRLRLYPLGTTGKIELFTDASDVACGAVLTQDGKPIEFFSRTFTPVECRYSTFERETLAMVTSILHFRNILIGMPFLLWTDHKPLMSWLVRPPKTERHARWLVKLQDYSFEILHIEGERNVLADLMSRPEGLTKVDCQRLMVATRQASQPFVEDTSQQINTISAICIGDYVYNNQVQSRSAVTGYTKLDVGQVRAACPSVNDSSIIGAISRLGFEAEIKAAQTPDFIKHCKVLPENLIIKDGMAYVKHEGTLKVLVPATFRERVLTFVHQIGHYGRKRTYNLLKATYQWPNMHSDVAKFVMCCETCQVNKKSRIPKRTWKRYPLSSRFKTVHIDIVGPLQKSRKGHLYMLTMIDRFSRWIEAVPLTTIRAVDCAEKFYKVWVTRYGVPDQVVSDQGSQFESYLYNDMLSRLGAKHVRTTAYHPQTNGKVERAHSTIKNILRCLSASAPDWEDVLPATLMAMRVAINEDGVSPSLLVYGEHLAMPGLLVGDTRTYPEDTMSEFVDKLRKDLQLLREFVFELHANQQKIPSEDRKFPYKHVWLLDPLLRHSLSPKYNGPYRVIATDQYPVIQIDVEGQIKRVTVDRLKPAPHLSEVAPFTWAQTGEPVPQMEPRPARFHHQEILEDVVQANHDHVLEGPLLVHHEGAVQPIAPVPAVAMNEEVIEPDRKPVAGPPVVQVPIHNELLLREPIVPPMALNINERQPLPIDGYTRSGRAVQPPDRYIGQILCGRH
jgi:hypothetical protein